MYVFVCVRVSVCLSVCRYVYMYEFPDDEEKEVVEPNLFNIFC